MVVGSCGEGVEPDSGLKDFMVVRGRMVVKG